MFYSQCLLSRKGPLGAIWVAAYFFKKLKKSQVKATHIPSSVDQILQKELDALAYRVLAYLLLGVVRIYSKKVDFLFDDCNKAVINVKNFVAKERNREKTAVPLTASTECFAIALPERFELDAFDLGILEDFHEGHVKSQEDITLQDGSQETESMDMYTMERFDMEEDLQFMFHETFSSNRNENKHESFAHDMNMDEETARDFTEETSIRFVEAEQLGSKESSIAHQNASWLREDPESNDILVEPQTSEDFRRAQVEDTDMETICTIVQRLVDPHVASADNQHRNGHSENSESKKTLVETSCEKMQHNASFPSTRRSPEAIHGIEEQTSGAKTIDGEKDTLEMTTLEEPEPISVTGSKDLPEGVENCRGHSNAEITEFELFCASHKDQSETSEVNLNSSEKGLLSDMTVSKDPSRGFNATDSVTPKTPSRLKISEGGTSPKFSIIPTPAGKDYSQVSRKRKCLIDDEVIIPNKIMKEMIEDSSKLLAKRRNAAPTDFPKRSKRFANPSRIFVDPLIQYGSLDLQSLFCQPIKLKNCATAGTPKDDKIAGRKKSYTLGADRIPRDVLSSNQTESAQEIMETAQTVDLTGLKVAVGNSKEVAAEMDASSMNSGIAHQAENSAETPAKTSVIAPETPVRTSQQLRIAPETPAVSEQVEIAPETPVKESTSIRYFKDTEVCHEETRPASPFTSFDDHPSRYCLENRELDTILMNEEVNADESQDLQQETWSARTRNVAKFLEKTFLEQKEREEEEKISLLRLCRGRIKKESARLFYETLVLKTKGYLEVKQDHPYSDVVLTVLAREQQKAC